MSDEAILSAVAGTEPSIYGLRWGERTRFAILDIDKNSKYRSALELAKLQERLAAVGLSATVYQSSDSGGWHLYLFFDDWADSGETNEHLTGWLRSHGYEIRGGVLEVFPSGMGLRLPLQPGFAWLDSKGGLIRTREELERDKAIASFLIDLEENKRNWCEAKNRIKTELEAIDRAKKSNAQAHEKAIDLDGFEGLFNYRLIPEKYQKGREYWRSGLREAGQRHDAILAVEHYLWHGDESAGVPALPAEHNDDPRYRLLLAWLEAKHNGFCNHINRGNWRKVEQQIKRACLWRRPFGAQQVRTPYPLTENAIERLIGLFKSTGRVWSMEDFKKGNDGRELEARRKIHEALQLLTDQGRTVTGRQLMRLTGCSYHTVKRHSDIWKISPLVTLPRAAGDKNPFLDHLGTGGAAPVAAGPTGSGKSFLNPPLDADSGDLTLDQDLLAERGAPSEDLEQAASLSSAVAPPSPPQAAATFRFGASSAVEPCELAPIDLGCLTPRALRLVAKARESDGMETEESHPSPPRTQPSTGVKHWLGGVSVPCGLNGFLPSCAEPPLGPPHLNPREISSKGSGSVMLQDDGGSAGFAVCYTSHDTVSGIKELSGATSRVGVLSSFWAKSKSEETSPHVTNSKFLTTIKIGFAPGVADEFSLIDEEPPGLNVISERSTGAPFGESLHQGGWCHISLCLQGWVRDSRFLPSTQEPPGVGGSGCRHWLDKQLWVRGWSRIRGPPIVDGA